MIAALYDRLAVVHPSRAVLANRAAIGSARNEVERRHLADRAAVLWLRRLTGDPAPG